jgi:dTDP-glucose 4,6-dehydratase
MFQPVKPLSLEDLEHVLEHTRELWSEASGKSFFITGGTGFFGMWLLESFAYINAQFALGMRATILTRDPVAFARKAPHLATRAELRFIQGDICSFPFPEGHFDYIIHSASDLSGSQLQNPVSLIESTLNGCRRVVKLACDRGARRFLFASSGAVYGPMTKGRKHLQENAPVSAMPLESQSAYMEAKRLGELICSMECGSHGVTATIARGFAFMGPYLPLDSHLAAPAFLKAALCGKEIVIQGHGQTVRSYLYGADLAIWLFTILLRGEHARPYNLGSDIPITIAQLAESTAKACGSRAGIRILGHLQPDETAEVYLPDINRARTELGLDVFTPFEESLKRAVLYYSLINIP